MLVMMISATWEAVQMKNLLFTLCNKYWTFFFYFFFFSFPNAFDMHRCNSRSCLRVRITSLNKFLIKFIWLFINMISFDVNKYVLYDCFDERCDHKYWGSRINHKKINWQVFYVIYHSLYDWLLCALKIVI